MFSILYHPLSSLIVVICKTKKMGSHVHPGLEQLGEAGHIKFDCTHPHSTTGLQDPAPGVGKAQAGVPANLLELARSPGTTLRLGMAGSRSWAPQMPLDVSKS